MSKHTIQELHQWQALPLDVKVLMTQQRIRDWVREYGTDGVYVSFSGGKDSTVLLHLVRDMFPSIPAVFVDTGLEYPEIRDFVKTFDNVVWLKPKMTFKQVIETYGYPFISKEVSNNVDGARRYVKVLNERTNERTEGCQASPVFLQLQKNMRTWRILSSKTGGRRSEALRGLQFCWGC